MTPRELLHETAAYLRGHGVAEARLDAEVLLAHVLEVERIDLYCGTLRPAPARARARLIELARRRALERVPVAYLVGSREFWSRSFRVTPEVLIPRPETETLVEAALEVAADLPGARPLRIAEVGVGSGAVSGALALELPRARFIAVDRSRAALALARQNLARLGLARRVSLVAGDGVGALSGPFGLIVSNPPYIPSGELERLPPEVRNEPALALDGGPDGLVLLRRLIRESPARLAQPGWLVLEVGSGQASRVRQLVEAAGARAVEIRRDLAGAERVVVARFAEA